MIGALLEKSFNLLDRRLFRVDRRGITCTNTLKQQQFEQYVCTEKIRKQFYHVFVLLNTFHAVFLAKKAQKIALFGTIKTNKLH